MHQEPLAKKEDIFHPINATVRPGMLTPPEARPCGIVNEKGVIEMSEKKRPLPEPHKSPFGRRRRQEESSSPLADDIARAAAEGRLEELFGKEIPDSEQARALVSMMMGMTGVASFAPPDRADEKASAKRDEDVPPPPEDLLRAAEGGDVAGLMGLLRKEHERRSGVQSDSATPEDPQGREDAGQAGKAVIEKEVIDGLIGIASDNGVSLDWLILRALKVYVRDYRQTGRL